MGRPRAWMKAAVATIVVASVGGCSSCRKKPGDEVSKDNGKKKLGVPEVPMPPDLAFELIVKDPDDAVKRGADAAGYGASLSPSPYEKALALVPDEAVQKVLRAIDPHGAVSFVIVGKPSAILDVDHWNKDTVQIAFAAHVKDAELARTALDTLSKTKGTKSGAAKGFDGRVYDMDSDTAVGLSGDVVLLGDGVDSLEKAGRYATYLADKGNQQEHDLFLRVPMDALEGEVKKSVPAAWAKAKTSMSPSIAVEIDVLVGPLLTAFGEAGDAVMWMDVKGDVLVAEQTMGAKGSLSTFLAKWPAGDASALLAMPQGDGAALYRWPDGLGPLVYASLDDAVDDAVKRGDLTTPVAADVKKSMRSLGGAIGHEVVYTSKTGLGFLSFGAGSGGLEYAGRLELSDAPTAKTAITTLRTIFEAEAKKPPAPVKLTVAPYKSFGAEGETITIPSGGYAYAPASASTISWAIRGSYLFVDGCLFCKPALFDDAIDPASTKTLASDAAAKKRIASFPSVGVVEAAYGDLGGYTKSLLMILGPLYGSSPSSTKTAQPIWAWGTVGTDGMHGHEEVPIKSIADLVALYTRYLGGMGAYGGSYPSPLGTPIPPPPPPPPIPPPKGSKMPF